jgi:hypothetical protein
MYIPNPNEINSITCSINDYNDEYIDSDGIKIWQQQFINADTIGSTNVVNNEEQQEINTETNINPGDIIQDDPSSSELKQLLTEKTSDEEVVDTSDEEMDNSSDEEVIDSSDEEVEMPEDNFELSEESPTVNITENKLNTFSTPIEQQFDVSYGDKEFINVKSHVDTEPMKYKNVIIGGNDIVKQKLKDYKYKKWIKLIDETELINIDRVLNDIGSEFNFIKLGFFTEINKKIKRKIDFKVYSKYKKIYDIDYTPWIYMITINRKLVKIGETSAGLKNRIKSYYTGHYVKERGESGRCSVTNAYIYNTILFNLREYPSRSIKVYGHRLKARECKVSMFGMIYNVNLAYSAGIEAILINWYLRTYKKYLILGMNRSPCISYETDITPTNYTNVFVPVVALNSLSTEMVIKRNKERKKYKKEFGLPINLFFQPKKTADNGLTSYHTVKPSQPIINRKKTAKFKKAKTAKFRRNPTEPITKKAKRKMPHNYEGRITRSMNVQ